MNNLKHVEPFPSDWPFTASEQLILRYTTDPKYREQCETMLDLLWGAALSAYKLHTLPELAEWRYMATWFYNSRGEDGSFSRAPGIPSDEFYTWPNMFLHIGPRPSPKYSIHRIDDTRNYEIGNLVWATQKIQASERRDKAKIKFRGQRLTYEQLSSELALEVKPPKSVDAIKSFLKRNRHKFKTEAALHAHMFATWGVINHEHIHDPGILKTSDFLPGYKNAVWWAREKEKAGPGMTRLEFQDKYFKRALADLHATKMGFKHYEPEYGALQHQIDDVNRHYKKFLADRDALKKQDAASKIAKYSSSTTDTGYFVPKVAGFDHDHT